MDLLIVGCGYVGTQVAATWQAAGKSVAAVTRGSEASVLRLRQAQIAPIVADWLDEEGSWTLPAARSVLVSVPHRPDERWGERTHCAGLANILSRLPSLERLVMISTTGVYHQTAGEWVDESSPTQPTRPGPRMALAAERWLAEHLPRERATVLRLAGIYGQGRIPLISKLRSAAPIPVADGDLNLIHVDDITPAIVKLLLEAPPQPLYVLSDGRPVPRRKFYEAAARIFATPPPNFMAPEVGSSRAGRGESDKRINPQRILRDLALTLKYPDYTAGLTAIAATESLPE